MSLDLLQEFGNLSHSDLANPWNTSTSSDPEEISHVDEDDFGEFEQPEEPRRTEASQDHGFGQGVSLSKEKEQQKGLLLIDTATAPPPPSPSPSFRELNAPLKLAIPLEDGLTMSTDRNSSEATPITAWPSYGRNRAKSTGRPHPLSPSTDDDEWGRFEEEQKPPKKCVITHEAKNPDLVTHERIKENTVRNDSLLDLADSLGTTPSPAVNSRDRAKISLTEPAAPSNIPPPSILLSLITSIFQSLSGDIRDIVSSTSTVLMDNGESTNDAILEKLAGKLAIIKASIRILAGRKLRWKRDAHLAQNMKIGPASAGKASGMKLTGIDRTESRREDQEATEAERLWKQQAGSLKSHIARINSQQSEIELVLPDISENIPIRSAKTGEGALTAPKCCFLCGLKRDERVARLDTSIEDSFGEWWVDHWGHVDCTRFWEEHKALLK
ncbi:MAG: hypothetical protein LQ343_000645 [Gyalolechia ehrenbergii]|nr:MAG: hypothetical protein LQ343_000645 [Gyalolechia ehrenbergii]